MHRELRSFFEKKQVDKPGDFFPSLSQVSIGGNGGLSTQFVKIMAAAKVGRGQSKAPAEGKAGRRNHGRSFHSLRHTFNSMMLNKGVAQEIRMKIVGHADAETNAGYSHAELQSLRVAVDLVPGMVKGSSDGTDGKPSCLGFASDGNHKRIRPESVAGYDKKMRAG